MNRHFLSRPGWQAAVAGLLAFGLYAATAAPSIFELYSDSLEFQLVGPTFGIAHPTGYPLYTLLGGLWSRLLFPFGNWAWRMNLLSGLAGGGAIALLFLLARRLSGSGWGAAAAALAFGLSPVWWAQTTAAEVYALHLLLLAGILYAATGRGRLVPLFLLIGLGLAHHRTTVLLLPGLAVYLLWQRPGIWRPRREWLGWAGALLLPLLLYLYLPLRAALGGADLEGAYVNNWPGFWQHVLATGYGGFFADNPLTVARTAGDWLALFVQQLGWPGLLLAVAGLAVGLWDRRMRPAWALVLLVLLANGLFGFSYRVGDVEVFFLPVFFCLALGAGNAVARLVPAGLPYAPGAKVLLLALLLSGWPGRGGPVNRSGDWAVHDYAVALAKVPFPPGSRVVGLRGQMTALAYMQQAEGLGQNATPVALDDPAARRAFVEEAVRAGVPVYLTQELSGIAERFSFSGHGPLVRVWPRGGAETQPAPNRLDLALADGGLILQGAALTRLEQAGGPALGAVFYWQSTRPLERTLKLSLRLLDAEGRVLHQADRFPLGQVAPSESWLPGETVRDVHSLPLPAAGPPRSLLVIVYDAESVAEVGRVVLPLPQSD